MTDKLENFVQRWHWKLNAFFVLSNSCKKDFFLFSLVFSILNCNKVIIMLLEKNLDMWSDLACLDEYYSAKLNSADFLL